MLKFNDQGLIPAVVQHARSGEASATRLPRQRAAGALLAAAFLGLVAVVLPAVPGGAAPPPEGFGTPQAVGSLLFTAYVLPFELASVILIVGIVAAVVIGRVPS